MRGKSGTGTRGRIMVIMIAVALLCSVLSAQVPASGSPRVRVTGRPDYQVPGLLTIAGDRVTGSVVTFDDGVMHVRLPQATETVAVPMTGRLAGRVVGVDIGILVLAQNTQQPPLRIPLDAIGRLEVSEGRRLSRALAVATGIGAWVGTTTAFAATQRFDSAWFTLGPLVVAPLAAITLGYLLGREHWKDVPVQSLPVPTKLNKTGVDPLRAIADNQLQTP